MNVPYIIAEAGVNHDGSVLRAMELVSLAAEAGASAIKFQAYRAHKLAAADSPTYFDFNGQPAHTQRRFFERYDMLNPEDYQALAEQAKDCGIDFLCTPFDEEAVQWLDPLVTQFKIASADITHRPLLETIAKTGKPVILSTGATTWEEIDRAVGWLYEAKVPKITLLHCVLSYPTTIQDAHLGLIRQLAARFPDCEIGYSDHTVANSGALETAWILGASVLEKHFTDDDTRPGNDHAHSITPDGLKKLVNKLDRAAMLIGEGDRKDPLPCEMSARVNARRSLYTSRALPAGHVLETGDLVAKRPGLGLEPFRLSSLLGRVLKSDVGEEHQLRMEDLA